ncbi:MAG: hypothetical protein ACXWIT_21350 [Burkholderiales bacterium]
MNILLLWSDATDKGFSSVALSFG